MNFHLLQLSQFNEYKSKSEKYKKKKKKANV